MALTQAGFGTVPVALDEPLDHLQREDGGSDVKVLAEHFTDHAVVAGSGKGGGVDDLRGQG
jgi:hypothetical protein